MGKIGLAFSIAYVILGLYFINLSFKIISLPASIATFNQWIFAISGVMLLLGAYFFHKYNRY